MPRRTFSEVAVLGSITWRISASRSPSRFCTPPQRIHIPSRRCLYDVSWSPSILSTCPLTTNDPSGGSLRYVFSTAARPFSRCIQSASRGSWWQLDTSYAVGQRPRAHGRAIAESTFCDTRRVPPGGHDAARSSWGCAPCSAAAAVHPSRAYAVSSARRSAPAPCTARQPCDPLDAQACAD